MVTPPEERWMIPLCRTALPTPAAHRPGVVWRGLWGCEVRSEEEVRRAKHGVGVRLSARVVLRVVELGSGQVRAELACLALRTGTIEGMFSPSLLLGTSAPVTLERSGDLLRDPLTTGEGGERNAALVRSCVEEVVEIAQGVGAELAQALSTHKRLRQIEAGEPYVPMMGYT